MEEVESSNLSRSTKTLQTLTANASTKTAPSGVQMESKPSSWSMGSMGSLGHVSIFVPAHDQAFGFNQVVSLGALGTVLHACCRLLETTKTFVFPIRMSPIARGPADNQAGVQ